MTSSNGNISRVTGLCVGNSPVTGEFPSQGPVTRSFDVFFDLRQNTRLYKQSRRRWFDTLSRSLWRHCNVYPSYYVRTGSFIIIPVSTPRTESICRFSTLLKMRKTTRRNKNVTHPIWIHFPCILSPANKQMRNMSSVWKYLSPRHGFTPLQWRRSERNDVSNHQRFDCLLKHLFRRRSKKTSKLRATGLCEENSITVYRWIPHTKGQ